VRREQAACATSDDEHVRFDENAVQAFHPFTKAADDS
jgi:hypothetical protein